MGIIRDFEKEHIPTLELSIKYNLPQTTVKKTLIEHFGKQRYKKLSSSVGGFVVSKKLTNPSYRKRFCEKLSKSVSSTIKQKMKKDDYYKRWVKKSKLASIKGNQKIKILLENDKEFKKNWVKNCRKGGEETYRRKKGVHDPNLLEIRMKGSLKGLRRTCRNQIGPLGEKMYNKLESDVARILLKYGLKYTYEKLYKSDNPNGYISCDFICLIGNKKLFIEATCWDSPRDKSKKLNKKFKIFKENEQEIICCVVTTNHTLKEKYKKFLDKDLIILNVKEFDSWLNKNVEIAASGVPYKTKHSFNFEPLLEPTKISLSKYLRVSRMSWTAMGLSLFFWKIDEHS